MKVMLSETEYDLQGREVRCESYHHKRVIFHSNSFFNLSVLYVLHRKYIFKTFAVISGQNSTKNAFPVFLYGRICIS